MSSQVDYSLEKATKRINYLLFSLAELDSYTDKMVGKVLTLVETLIEDKERRNSAKSVAREYLYQLDQEIHSHINRMMDVPYTDTLVPGNNIYNLPLAYGDEETVKQREEQIKKIIS